MTPVALDATTSDAQLISLSMGGNQKAFRELVNRYLTPVYQYLYRMTQSHEMSEEMTQETFVKVYKNLSSFDGTRPFKPWVLRIASNTAITALRKQSKVVSLNALQEDGHWHEAEAQILTNEPRLMEEPSLKLERKLSNEAVMKALEHLDAKYRQVLLLRYTQELSYEEIAEALNIPLNTVRTWIKRGLEKLRQQIAQTGKEPDYA